MFIVGLGGLVWSGKNKALAAPAVPKSAFGPLGLIQFLNRVPDCLLKTRKNELRDALAGLHAKGVRAVID
jgi:hypothetical protein